MFYDDQLSAVMQSLPMRERGLKFHQNAECVGGEESLPCGSVD